MSSQIRLLEDRLRAIEEVPASDDLVKIQKAIAGRSENQRRNIGGAFQISNFLIETSKKFIKTLKHGNYNKVGAYRSIFVEAWNELKELDLPADFGWQKDNEAGGEVVEAEAVFQFLPLLQLECADQLAITKECRAIIDRLWYKMGDPDCDGNLASLKDIEEELEPAKRTHLISTSFTAWLAGLGDAIGELSKFVKDMMIAEEFRQTDDSPMSRQERKQLLKRFILIAEAVYGFMEEFETCYGMTINNSRRRGWRNTFRGALGGVGGLLQHYKEKLMDMLNQDSI